MTLKRSKQTVGTTFKQTKVKGKLNIAVFGDVHLGHLRTKTNEIIKKLYKIFPDNEETHLLDFIFIEGDLFDHLLYLNNDFIIDIHIWCEWLIAKCNKHKIALRVLEGTPSHDMRQPALLDAIASKYRSSLDFKYVDKLDIEFHEPTGISILYLPDEWTTPIENCFNEAKQLIQLHGLQQVDFVCMHGAFDYQLPPVEGISTHNRTDWESIVKYYIMVGHVHFPSQNGKVLAAGSFDRLRHGEEGPKGHLRITISQEKNTINFVENKEAKIYTSIDCSGLEVEQLIAKVAAIVEDAPSDSYFRLVGRKQDGLTVARRYLSEKYPQFNWSDPVQTDDTEKVALPQILENTFQPIHLTKSNLPKLLEERLRLQHTSEITNRCIKLLHEAL